MSKIRILSLDGGGSRAGVLATTLGALYGRDTPGRDIVRQFDFIAGNSGGSIVLTALCCNYTPDDIEIFYRDPATLRRMFSPKWTARVPLLRWLLPRYSTAGKFEALKWMFDQNQQEGEPLPSTIPLQKWPDHLKSGVNLIVTAFDYDRERAAFFRSNRDSRAKSSAPAIEATLADAVNASTCAPIVYYDKPAEVSGRRFWDGALAGLNNPVLAAVAEALVNRSADLDDFRVLSLGTGATAQPLTTDGALPPLGKPPDSTCALRGVIKVATAAFADPPDAATFHAHVALRQPMPRAGGSATAGNVVRLSPLVRPVWDQDDARWRLPRGLTESEFQALIDMPLDAMRAQDIDLTWKMWRLWASDDIPNQPIRMGEHMSCDIGHAKYSEAVAHWQRIA